MSDCKDGSCNARCRDAHIIALRGRWAEAITRAEKAEAERDEDRHEVAAMLRQRADALAEDALEPNERARNLPAALELLEMAAKIEGGCNAEASEIQVLIADHAKVTVFAREVQAERDEARTIATRRLRALRSPDRKGYPAAQSWEATAQEHPSRAAKVCRYCDEPATCNGPTEQPATMSMACDNCCHHLNCDLLTTKDGSGT